MKRVLLSLTCLGVLSMSASGDLVPAQIVGGTLNEGYEYYGWDYDEDWYNEYQLTDYPQGHSADYSSWTVTDDSLSFSTSYYDWSYDTMGPDGNSNGYAEEDYWGVFSAEIQSTNSTLVSGWGNVVYQVFDAGGDLTHTGMTGDLGGLQLAAGLWTFVIRGSGTYAEGGSFNYSKGEYDYWGHEYTAEGGIDITAVPGPGGMAVLCLAGLAAGRRRRR